MLSPFDLVWYFSVERAGFFPGLYLSALDKRVRRSEFDREKHLGRLKGFSFHCALIVGFELP